MSTVGIIANPASGKDIRRLVAHGSVFDNQEKVSIVRRVLLGLEATGVEKVLFMPDYFGIGSRALNPLKLTLRTAFLEMPLCGTQEDSTLAAQLLEEAGAGCIVTLGGDGTNRAVAKGSVAVPLMPISTGTNNVFPYMVEGTVAGLAAGVVARGIVDAQRATERTRKLEIWRDGQLIDIALIDAVVYDDVFIASRAIWDMAKVREIVLTRAEPSNIGLSSIGGNLCCTRLNHDYGVYIQAGRGKGVEVTAPVAPGLIERVNVTGYQLLSVGDKVEVTHKPSVLALDGERELELRQGSQVTICLSDEGPRVVNVWKTLQEAARGRLFTRSGVQSAGDGNCALCEAGICLTPCEQCRLAGAESTPGRKT